MAGKQTRRMASAAGAFLKRYRKQHGLTQEQLASDLNIEPRTLRAYENGERSLHDINELYRIADRLGVEPEQLGVVGRLHPPRSPQDIEELLTHAWSLVEAARLYEARAVIEHLTQSLSRQITGEQPELLRALARSYHTAGYIVSLATRAPSSQEALIYYRNLEEVARLLRDDTLLAIALTYQGDLHRRLGHLEQATLYLEAARDTTPQADQAARGNALQLLARTYLRRGEVARFETAMRQAEELAPVGFDPSSSTHGCYSLGTVYEEYGRSYADMGQPVKAMEFLQRAETHLPSTPHWRLLVETAKMLALIKGNEFEAGITLALALVEEIRRCGTLRYLDRLYLANRFLKEQEQRIGKASAALNEALLLEGAPDY
ncbi:helix-turn-helix domain-containing protein [Thermogemmatispora sp.]|uniref:helix-turn-helix domain-containing protein n=1 Tax=Thermogemmatispora sp. TaxID=1968838 RepID=UPI001D9DD57D|nr:helix-turn-helix domain-containing protein [Thermogemmatispora sp.]MBX5452112.1 helix-turn-helix domain-containing protein [Thermogemmatispora sp.]